jgi:hypothetical protein
MRIRLLDRILDAARACWEALPPGAEVAEARRRYFALDARCETWHDALGKTGLDQPERRSELLEKLADDTLVMSELHTPAFGPDPIEWENGRDLADSWHNSSTLYWLLSLVENCVADPAAPPPRWGTNSTIPGLAAAAGPILDRMIAEPHNRIALLDDLYDAVHDIVGGQAAETIACLPAPGRTVGRSGYTFPPVA